jgi:hypothetical protein
VFVSLPKLNLKSFVNTIEDGIKVSHNELGIT